MKIFRTFIGVAALLATTIAGYAQTTATSSPYSMYGYGIIGDRATSSQRAMGSVGYAMSNGRQINAMNPASYAAIDSLTFLFDVGADISFIRRSENSLSENTVGGGLDYITLQFPISKHFGGSAGLLPYSSVGYSFGNDIKHGAKSNQGSGGINEAYLGFAGKIGGFSLGFNVSYNFGNIQKDLYTTPSTGNSLFEQVMEIRDWNINIGAQYNQTIAKYHKIGLGAVFSPKKTMHGNTFVTVQELTQESVADTLGTMKLRNHFYQPMTIGGGLSYTYERSSRFNAEVDFTWQEWSKAPFPGIYANDESGQLLVDGMTFNNRYKGAFGVEFIPRLRGNYLQKIAYRVGANYCRDYLNIFGNDVKEYSLTCGLGLPTPEGKTVINLGFEWKHRNSSPVKMISENYFCITLGVNFNEMWFWKRKIQ